MPKSATGGYTIGPRSGRGDLTFNALNLNEFAQRGINLGRYAILYSG
jgi:hypothetical protein